MKATVKFNATTIWKNEKRKTKNTFQVDLESPTLADPSISYSSPGYIHKMNERYQIFKQAIAICYKLYFSEFVLILSIQCLYKKKKKNPIGNALEFGVKITKRSALGVWSQDRIICTNILPQTSHI